MDGDNFPEDDSPVSPVFPNTPPPTLPAPARRRPSEAATLVPQSPTSLYPSRSGSEDAEPSRSRSSTIGDGNNYNNNSLRPTVDSTSRSRASSVGGASMLSGDTAHTDTPYDRISYDGPTKKEGGSGSSGRAGFADDEDALRPDPGTEKDFVAENNPFAFTPGQLNKFLNPKSLAAFKAVGGLRGLESGLRTDLGAGLSVDEATLAGHVSFAAAAAGSTSKDNTAALVQRTASTPVGGNTSNPGNFGDRKRIYSDNSLPMKKAKSIFRLMWEQYNDKILILLTVAAVVSLTLGLYESLGVKHEPGAPPSVDWIEGVAICVAIVIVVAVGSLNDWQKERQFVKLNAKVRGFSFLFFFFLLFFSFSFPSFSFPFLFLLFLSFLFSPLPPPRPPPRPPPTR